MKDFIKLIGWLCLLPVLTGCGNDEDVSGTPEASDLPILVSLAQDKQSGSSRATIFEDADDLKDVSKGGGNFHLNAYYLETGKESQTYLNAQVKYFPESEGAIPWLFFDAGKNDTYKAYWPKNGVLDFFAYMPYNLGGCSYISNIGYTQAGGPTFTATLPSKVNINDAATQEFIYAYRKEMTSQSELDEKKRVEMKFVHPFAVVYFELIQSKRLNPLATIEFQKIYHQGTFANATDTKTGTVTGGWGGYQDQKNDTITIGKKIPEDINFNTVFAGPFLVIPQSIDGVNMQLKGTDAGGDPYEPTPIPIYTTAVKSWLPGKKYTYSLKLEDPGEEILFDVKVEDWKIIKYDNIVNVE